VGSDVFGTGKALGDPGDAAGGCHALAGAATRHEGFSGAPGVRGAFIGGATVKYTRKFARLEDLTAFLRFHMEETGLLFYSDSEQKTAWIDADERICRELTLADG
jgi:hypothetical protein